MISFVIRKSLYIKRLGPLAMQKFLNRARTPLAALGLLLAAACADEPTGTSAIAPTAARPALTLASDASPFGINLGQAYDPTFGPAVLNRATSAGMGWVRIDVSWNAIQQTQSGGYDWSQVDSTVSYAHARGISVLGVLAYTPSWANGDTTSATHTIPPTDMAAWQAFVTAAANRYAGRVQAWNVWNEPNCPEFFKTRSNYADYDSLVALAAGPIHAAGGLVVAGDPAMGCGDVKPWLSARVAANGSVIDALAVHGYNEAGNLVAEMEAIHAAIPSKPLWLTESGHSYPDTRPAGDAKQAEHLFDMYRATMQRGGWWKKTFQYHLYVWAPNHEWGVLRGTTLSERPAYNTYRLIAAGCAGNPDCVAVHRWWKQNDHLFGNDPNEGYGAGYSYEGAPFKLSTQAFSTRMAAVYRCVILSTNQHYLTDSASCDGISGTHREGVVGYAVDRNHSIPGTSMVPLYRLYLPGNGSRLTTISASERTALLGAGYQDEGIIGYVWP